MKKFEKEILNKMSIRKRKTIQIRIFSTESIEKIRKGIAEERKKQTLTYKIKNFFKKMWILKK